MIRRARRPALSSLLLAPALLALALLHAAPAHALGEPILEDEETGEFASPRWFFFEVKLGPYTPNIDAEFDGAASPFDDLFDGGMGLMVKGELDVSFWRPFGTFAVGGVVGWYGNSANNFEDTTTSGSVADTSKRTAGESTLTLIPLSLLLIYRADFLWDRWGIPLIPYAKFGINYTIWWINKGDGSVATAGGQDAKGGTFGWQFNGGALFCLDVLEPSAAKTMDVELGINHTFLFFEFIHFSADGFGSDTALRVGDTTFQGGLAFEF